MVECLKPEDTDYQSKIAEGEHSRAAAMRWHKLKNSLQKNQMEVLNAFTRDEPLQVSLSPILRFKGHLLYIVVISDSVGWCIGKLSFSSITSYSSTSIAHNIA